MEKFDNRYNMDPKYFDPEVGLPGLKIPGSIITSLACIPLLFVSSSAMTYTLLLCSFSSQEIFYAHFIPIIPMIFLGIFMLYMRGYKKIAPILWGGVTISMLGAVAYFFTYREYSFPTPWVGIVACLIFTLMVKNPRSQNLVHLQRYRREKLPNRKNAD